MNEFEENEFETSEDGQVEENVANVDMNKIDLRPRGRRGSRASGSRMFDKRSNIRSFMYSDDVDNTDLLYLDLRKKPRDMVYMWAAADILDMSNSARIIQLRKKGWDFVPKERHPERNFGNIEVSSFGNREYSNDRYIYCKGAILMERPKTIDDIEKSRLQGKVDNMYLTAPGLRHFQSDNGFHELNESNVSYRNARFNWSEARQRQRAEWKR